MAYKFKPRKSIAKRFRVTGTGKLKHERTNRRHLLSGRSGDQMRRMARPGILDESHGDRLRTAMGLAGVSPRRTRHERQLAEAKQGE